MQAVLHLWLGQRPVSEQAKKLVPLKEKKRYKMNNDSIWKDKYLSFIRTIKFYLIIKSNIILWYKVKQLLILWKKKLYYFVFIS